MKKTLPFFSYLFHPIFIPVFATVFYFYSHGSDFVNFEKNYVFFQITILTLLLPILFFFLLRFIGKVDSIMVAEVSQRKIPLLIHVVLLILVVKKSITMDKYPELYFFFLGVLLSTLLALSILFFKTKASLHMLSLSAFTVFVIALSVSLQTQNTYFIAFLLLMNGIVASSRLEMKAHTIIELILGFLLGSTPQLLLLYLWL